MDPNDVSIVDRKVVVIEPALSAEPTRWQAGDVKKCVSTHAHHLGSVPSEEGTRSDTDTRGMSDTMEADGAALPLIRQGPAETEQANREARDELNKIGER